MILTTVVFAIENTVRIAVATANHAMNHAAWAAVELAQTAKNLYVENVSRDVLNAERVFVNYVWKTAFVKHVKNNQKYWRIKTMKQLENTITSKWQADKKPFLRFSPYAWAKLLYFRDKGKTEIGGFGITDANDLLYIIDFITVKQNVTSISVSFDDNAVADFFDSQVDLGRKPEQFARIWVHSHPGDSPDPSLTDETTFKRVFGSCQWAIMFILAQDDSVHASLSFNTGPRTEIMLQVKVDYTREFNGTEIDQWDKEFQDNINPMVFTISNDKKDCPAVQPIIPDYNDPILPTEWLEEFERMEPAERQFILDELSGRPELWNTDEGVMCI